MSSRGGDRGGRGGRGGGRGGNRGKNPSKQQRSIWANSNQKAPGEDRDITCRDCSKPFAFTARAQVRSLHSRCKDQILGTSGIAALKPLSRTPVHPLRSVPKEAYRAVHN